MGKQTTKESQSSIIVWDNLEAWVRRNVRHSSSPSWRRKSPSSAGTVARLKEGWQAEWQEWKKRPLDGLDRLTMALPKLYRPDKKTEEKKKGGKVKDGKQ